MNGKRLAANKPIYLDPFWSETEEPYGGSIRPREYPPMTPPPSNNPTPTDKDPAVTPSYYRKGDLECYDVQKASMGLNKYQGYLEGCVQKYLWRWEDKNGKQDLEKALEYLVKLIETLE
jgi:hypothetical protein